MIELKSGVRIPESAIVQQITASLDGTYVSGPLSLVQYDDTMPVVAVQLTTNQQPYIPGESAELNYRMGKPWPDTHAVYNPCLGVDEDGVVYFSVTLQGTTTPGETTLTVEVTDGGVKNSAPIRVLIARNPVQEGQIESEDEFLTLQEILAQCQKYGQIVEANAANIQTVADNLPAIKDAPAAAERAEAAAAEAEKSAAESKGFRTFFSAVRPDTNGNLDHSRPMTVGPAASVEIESAGDRIQSVTALGFTTQAGNGDPSPTNVRQLTNGGLKLVAVTFDGSSDENWVFETVDSGRNRYYIQLENAAQADTGTGFAISNWLKLAAQGATGNPGVSFAFTIASNGRLYVRTNEESLADFKSRLAADPLTVWYATTDGTGSLYAPIILTSGEYRATCLPLTAPLCEGDSVVSWAKSGCDAEATLNGTETWKAFSGAPGVFYTDITGEMLQAYVNQVYANRLVVNTGRDTAAMQPGEFLVQIKDGYLRFVYKYDTSSTDPSVVTAAVSSDPITFWYRSANYTEADDIAVSLETHQQAVLVLDGTSESWYQASGGNAYYCSVKGKSNGTILSDYLPYATATQTAAGQTGIGIGAGGSIQLRLPNGENPKEYLPTHPLTIVYELATPITYAHPAVVLEAATGDQLTYTVTGQSGGTVSVALKPFQDGGHAKTADSAQQLDGLTLAALQNLLVPVGFIFSWAPVDDGPDLSTAQKVAAYFGFGTWAAYGTGQVLVGVDSGQTEFASVGKTGGEKAHSLTTAEGPKHAHGVKWEHEGGLGTGNGVLIKDANDGESYPYTYFTEFSGSGQAHNNLQPYITVYRWQRIA